MAITMTEAAASRVHAFLDNRGKGLGLRLGVKTTGCSGMAYVLEFVDETSEGDQVFEHMGIDTINSYWPFIQSPYQKDYNGKNSVQYQFESNTGDCLMFPSYYRHYVRPNLSNEDRISISFNFG